MDIGRNLALVEFSGFLVYRVGIGRILMSVDFGGSSGLVESSGFFMCGVGIHGIFLFWFGVVVKGGA